VARASKKIRDWDSYKADAYDEDPEASRLLLRSELVLAAHVDDLIKLTSQELYRYVAQKAQLLNEEEGSLYVSRLLHMSGQYIYTIALSAQLANSHPQFWEEHPDQLLLVYPRPYLSSYQRAASQHYLDPELALAISRQESSFQAEAMSPAEAIGLMQLIAPTAERQALRIGVKSTQIKSDLKRPDFNINLGTGYLAELGRRYRGQWPQAFAAYNAGEYVVDAWLLRRPSPDPIAWVEGLSFGETSTYVKNVWRNWEVYKMMVSKP
jgi:soluble lytic murein transglycosylase-like protein